LTAGGRFIFSWSVSARRATARTCTFWHGVWFGEASFEGLTMTTVRDTEELTMVAARRELTKLPERLNERPVTVAVTRRGRPVLAIMSWEDYEAVVETLEILGDEQAMDLLRRSLAEVKEGRAIGWEEAKATMGA
jgi:prevent-host-death family protein